MRLSPLARLVSPAQLYRVKKILIGNCPFLPLFANFMEKIELDENGNPEAFRNF
jgi:hypothetical protein